MEEEKKDEKEVTERISKHGFPNIINKKKLVSIKEIFNDINIKSKIFKKRTDEKEI